VREGGSEGEIVIGNRQERNGSNGVAEKKYESSLWITPNLCRASYGGDSPQQKWKKLLLV